MVPGAPPSLRARAIAVIRSSAAIASAGGSSRPARAAFPEDSGHVSTRAICPGRLGAAAQRGRVEVQDHRPQRRAQLPGRHRPRLPEERHRGRGCLPVAQAGQLAGEDRRAGPIDPAREQRREHRRQPDQIPGQSEQDVGRPPGQHQRRRQLVTDMLARPRRTRPVRRPHPAGVQLRHRGELGAGLPGGQPPRGPQDSNQLVIGQPFQVGVEHVLGHCRQRRTGRQVVERTAGREACDVILGYLVAGGPEDGFQLGRRQPRGPVAVIRRSGERIGPVTGQLGIGRLVQQPGRREARIGVSRPGPRRTSTGRTSTGRTSTGRTGTGRTGTGRTGTGRTRERRVGGRDSHRAAPRRSTTTNLLSITLPRPSDN